MLKFQKAVLKEQLAQTANKMAAGAPAHLAAVVREPIAELNARWAKLYGALADRQHKVEYPLKNQLFEGFYFRWKMRFFKWVTGVTLLIS